MQIKLDVDTIPDELYNLLLQTFVNEAVLQGKTVTPGSTFENWTLTAELQPARH